MESHWSFLTNHAHVMVCLSTGRDLTLREIAAKVGITERATHRIVDELVREGAIKKTKHGRCNHYELQPDFPLRHPLEEGCSVGQLLRAVTLHRDNSAS